MSIWWKKSNKSQNISTNTMISSSNEHIEKKKSRSLVSFFLDKQRNSTQQIVDTNLNRKTIKDDLTGQTHPSVDIDWSQYKRDPTLTYYQGHSTVPKQWRTTQTMHYSNIKSPTYYDTQLKTKDNLDFNNHFNGYLQLFDQLINENNSCFGFSLVHITSKYCLYMTIIIFLGICLIISLTAVFKKQ
jgi:hypothetical protein